MNTTATESSPSKGDQSPAQEVLKAMNSSVAVSQASKERSRKGDKVNPQWQGRFVWTPDVPGFMRPRDPQLKPKLNLKCLGVNPSIDVCVNNESISTIDVDDAITFFDASTIATNFEIEDLGDVIHTPVILSESADPKAEKRHSTSSRERRKKRRSRKRRVSS